MKLLVYSVQMADVMQSIKVIFPKKDKLKIYYVDHPQFNDLLTPISNK